MNGCEDPLAHQDVIAMSIKSQKNSRILASNQKCDARSNQFHRDALPRGRNDRYGYARVRQTIPHALRDLSPLSATASVGVPKCLAHRSGLTWCRMGFAALTPSHPF